MSKMESINEQFDKGYFYCPNCGKKVIDHGRILVKSLHKKQYEQLSEAQKEYIDENLKYLSIICNHCKKIDNRNSFILGLLLLMMLAVYSINDLAGVCIGFIIIGLKITLLKSTSDFNFERAWECGTVKRTIEQGDTYGNSGLIVSIGTIIWIIATIIFSILLITNASEEIVNIGDWIFVLLGLCCMSVLIYIIIIGPALYWINDLFHPLLKQCQDEDIH